MKRACVSLLALLGLIPVVGMGASHPRPRDLAHTFSIVAHDPRTGQMGVAVQSHWFSVGSVVTWAEAGVGAVATQSFVQPSYGRDGLELMRKGTSAPDALYQLLKADPARNVRQVAFVDAEGNSAVWTGSRCIDEAGHIAGGKSAEKKIEGAGSDGVIHTGQGYTVQANMMVKDEVWPAMDKAFNQTKGDLADRLLAALDAAQGAGGDARGKQSAAMLIVKAKPSGKPWEDREFDLRVEDHESPLVELRRLAGIARAYQRMNAGDLAVERKDNEAALREYGAAAKVAQTVPGIDKSRLAEMSFWHAQALVQMGRVDESLPLFEKAFELHADWLLMAPRVQKAGLLPNDPEVIDKIMAQAPKGDTLPSAARNKEADESTAEEIRQLVKKYTLAVDAADIDLASQVWRTSAGITFIHPGGHARGWEEVKEIYKFFGSAFSERKLTARDVSVHVNGDTAWVEFYWDFVAKQKNDGSAVHTEGRETQIYFRVANDWRLVHVHYSGPATRR